MQIWIISAVIVTCVSSILVEHKPTDISEYKRQFAFVFGNLFLGSGPALSAYSLNSLNSSLGVSVLSPFSSTVALKIRRVFSTATPGQVLVHAEAGMYHPIQYLYVVNVANATEMRVLRSLPITCVQLTNPILGHTTDGTDEYIIAIDDSSALHLMQIHNNSISLLSSVTQVNDQSFAPLSISAFNMTVIVADKVNGLLVFAVQSGELVLRQTIAVEGTATSVYITRGSAWVASDAGVMEFELGPGGQLIEVDIVYPMIRLGLYPYFLYGTELVLGYMQYSNKDESYLSIFPRTQEVPLLTHKVRFDPFLVVNTVLYECAKNKIVATHLNLIT